MIAFTACGRGLAPLGALVLLASMLAPTLTMAQGTAPAGQAQEPSRILQVEDLSGTVTIRRAGRDISAQPGYLIFAQEQVALASGSHLGLRLAKHGRIDLAPLVDQAALITEKLPFSSWAVDLGTRLRLEAGILRVVWARPSDDAKWPVAVLLGPWGAKLGTGEFLFRRDKDQTLACNVSGSLEVSDGGTWKFPVEAGDCLRLDRGPAKRQLVASEWAVLRPPEPSAKMRSVEASTKPEASGLEAALDAALTEPPVASASQVAAVAAEPTPAGAAIGPRAVPPPPPPPVAPKRDQRTPALEKDIAAAADVQAPAGSATAPIASSRGAVRQGSEVLTPVISSPGAISTLPVIAEPALPKAAAPPAAPPKSPAPGPAVSAQPARPVSTTPKDASTGTAVATLEPVDAAAGPEWIVNVLSVADPAEAEGHVKRLIEAGYPASLRSETVRGRQSYRIVVSGLGSSQAATRLVELLNTKMGYPTAWALQKR